MDHYHKTDLFKSRMITEKPEQRAVSTLKACGPVPMCNTSALKQNFLHGDKAAVMYCDKKESIPSTYQNRYKGLQIYKDHARIVDDYRITLAGTTAPDPQVLRATGHRYAGFSQDLKNTTGMEEILRRSTQNLAQMMNTGDDCVFQQKDRFGGEENDGTRTGPIM